MGYRGFTGAAEYNDDAGIFHSEAMNTRGAITLEGKSIR